MWRELQLYARPGAMFVEQLGAMLTEAGVVFQTVQLATRSEQDEALARFRATGFPFVTVDGQLVGGFPEIVQAHADGRLLALIQTRSAERAASVRPGLPRRPSSSSTSLPAVRDPRPPATTAPAAEHTPAPGAPDLKKK